MNTINRFYSQWSFLSNFAASKFYYVCSFNKLPGRFYPTAEHAYQAAKTLILGEQARVARASNPGEAKKLGRKITMRDDWEEIKYEVMLDILRAKFTDVWMRNHLLETDNALIVEGNTWHDNEWGDCSCKKCEFIVGKNMLGKALMQVRKELQEARE